jgi:hypothetical protein
VAAAADPGTEVQGVEVAGESRGQGGRWAVLRRRRREPVAAAGAPDATAAGATSQVSGPGRAVADGAGSDHAGSDHARSDGTGSDGAHSDGASNGRPSAGGAGSDGAGAPGRTVVPRLGYPSVD